MEVFPQNIGLLSEMRKTSSAVSPSLGLSHARPSPGLVNPGARRRTSDLRGPARQTPCHSQRPRVGNGVLPPGLPRRHQGRSPAPAFASPRAGAMETVTRRQRLPRQPMGAHVVGRRGRRSSKMAARPSRAALPGGSQQSRVKPPLVKGLKEQLPPLAAARAVFAAATAVAMRRG